MSDRKFIGRLSGCLVVSALLVAGCHESKSPQTAGQPAGEEAGPSASSKSAIAPSELVLPGVRAVAPARTAAELLNRYPPSQRAQLERFYESYGAGEGVSQYSFSNVMDFKNEAQFEWLMRNGFPTPEEVLAASSMTDDALLDLAKAGNVKAGAFLLRRISEAEARSEGGSKVSVDLMDLAKVRTSVIASGTPFAGYAVADAGLRNGRVNEAMAGYAYASYLGDTRALDFMRAVEASGRPVSASATLLSYRELLSIAQRNPQLANMKVVSTRQQFPRF